MKTKTILSSVLLSIFLFITILGCKKYNDNSTSPSTTLCTLLSSDISSSEMYSFNTSFDEQFSQSPRWRSNAEITLNDEKGQLSASNKEETILEAWKLFRKQMPYNQSWEISADVHIPLYWNSNGGKKAQVGVGLFVGKPVSNGESSKVYECNMASINGDIRFVQAQLVANRLGDDPIDVQFKELDKSKENATLKIQFCETSKSLSLYIDDNLVGKGQAINNSGMDNWNLSEQDLMDIGIMGFAEHTIVTSNLPTIDNFSYSLY